MNKVLKVKCPHCEKEFNYYSSEYRPFCSQICRQIDLGHWLLESYTIPVKAAEDDNEEKEKEDNDEQNEA